MSTKDIDGTMHLREAKQLEKLCHDRIVRLYTMFGVKNSTVLLMEYIPGMDLKNFIK